MDEYQVQRNEKAAAMADCEALRPRRSTHPEFTSPMAVSRSEPFPPGAEGRPERELERLCAMLDHAESQLANSFHELNRHLNRFNGCDTDLIAGLNTLGQSAAEPRSSFHNAHARAERIAMQAEALSDAIGSLDNF